MLLQHRFTHRAALTSVFLSLLQTIACVESSVLNVLQEGPPADPSNVMAIAISPTAINLTWQDNSKNEEGFLIERTAEEDEVWLVVASTPENVVEYEDGALEPRTVYSYRVRATGSGGLSGYSNSSTARTLDPPGGKVTGAVYADRNRNGELDEGEALHGVVMHFRDHSSDHLVVADTTDAHGRYAVPLPPGFYFVELMDLPEDLLLTEQAEFTIVDGSNISRDIRLRADQIIDAVVFKAQTHILDSLTVEQAAVAEDLSVITLPVDAVTGDTLAVGDVLMAGVTEVSPMGFLRKITSVAVAAGNGSRRVYQTEQALLVDAIKEAEIVLDTTLAVSSAALVSPVPGVVPVPPTPSPDWLLFFELDDLVIYDGDGNLDTTDDQIRVTGTIGLGDVTLYFRKAIKDGETKTFRYGAETSLHAAIDVDWSFFQVKKEASLLLGTITHGIILAPGVVVVPVTEIIVGVEGTLSAGLTVGAQADLTVGAGFHYARGVGFSPWGEFTPKLEWHPPRLSAKAEVEAFVRAPLVFLVYGVGGPYTQTKAGVGLTADLFADPWWELAITISGNSGVKANEKLGKILDIPEWESPELFGLRIPLGDAGGPFNESPSATISKPTAGTLFGAGQEVRFEGTGVDPEDGKLTGTSLSWRSNRDGHLGTGESLATSSLSVGEHTISLRVTDSRGASGEDQVQITIENLGTVATIYGVVRDLQSYDPLIAQLTLTGGPLGETRATATQVSGEYTFTGLLPGTYVLVVEASGYKTNTAANVKVLDLAAGDVVKTDFSLPALSFANPVANLAGRVTDVNGVPLSSVAVGISGGTQTNGVFRSTVTAVDGTYALSGIILVDSKGSAIPSFSVVASLQGYASGVLHNVQLSEGETRTNVDFVLSVQDVSAVYFEDGFESGMHWQATGLWTRTTGSGVVNQAYPTYVDLPAGDLSGGALPPATEGTWYAWYGDEQTGNFLKQQALGDSPKSGGRSTSSHSGYLLSPVFSIPQNAGSVLLTFETWFEIEGVNPNENGYDLMIVGVEDAATGSLFQLGRLNPMVDPELADRYAIPFTTGGFNRAPVFRPSYFDLSSFAGKEVRLVFLFDTVDPLYNGFRGWIVDAVRVMSSESSLAPQAGQVPGMPEALTRIGARCGTDLCVSLPVAPPRDG